MGADGHYYLMKRETFAAQFPDVDPAEDLCVYPVTVLGVDALCAYTDTDGRDSTDDAKTSLAAVADHSQARIDLVKREGKDGVYEQPHRGRYSPAFRIVAADEQKKLDECKADPDYAKHCRNREALNWFFSNAEDHEVWT